MKRAGGAALGVACLIVLVSPSLGESAGLGVEFVQAGWCPAVHRPGEFGDPRATGDTRMAVLVPDQSLVSDDRAVRELLLLSASRFREICGPKANEFNVAMWPQSVKKDGAQGLGMCGTRCWASAGVRFDQTTGKFTLSSPQAFANREGERLRRLAPLANFLKTNGLPEYVNLKDLRINPYVYQGKVVVTDATYVSMRSSSEAMFEGMLVTGVSPTRFGVEQRAMVLVGRIGAVREIKTPTGGVENVPVMTLMNSFDSGAGERSIKEASLEARTKRIPLDVIGIAAIMASAPKEAAEPITDGFVTKTQKNDQDRQFIRVVSRNGETISKGLLKFDLTGRPSRARAATVRLFAASVTNTNQRGQSFSLGQVRAGWDRSVTWSTSPFAFERRKLPIPTAGVWYEIDVTDMYNEWASGSLPNFGIELRASAFFGEVSIDFYSTNNQEHPELRPQFVVVPMESATGSAESVAGGQKSVVGSATLANENSEDHLATQDPKALKAYKDCLARGVPKDSCSILYLSGDVQTAAVGASPPGPQLAGQGGDSTGKRAAVLESQMTALLKRQPGAPSEPEKTILRQDGRVSFAYPASWELFEEKGVLVATIAKPGEGSALSDRAQITLTRSLAGRVPLDTIVADTINGTRNTLSNTVIAGPVKTQMAGADARVFFVTGTEAGRFRQKAVTVALSNGSICGVVLHATPDTFESVWDAYVRVKNSYKVD